MQAPLNRLRLEWLRYLRARFFAVVIVLFFAAMLGTLLSLYHSSTSLIEQEALNASRSTARAMLQARDLYSERVVARLEQVPGLEVSHNYHPSLNHFPIPATFLIELSEALQRKNPDLSVRYYSRYPFPWRAHDGGPQDDFEREALKVLEQNPGAPFSRIEPYEGRLSLRYAEADVMKPNCVACHNTRADSPKKDWQVGQTRGVLEVSYPLDQFQDHINASFNRHLLVMLGSMALGLTGLSVAFREAIKHQTRIKTNQALQQLNQELEERVEQRTFDLKQSQEFLNQITENITSVFWIWDVATQRFIYVSPAYEQLWGLSRDELYRTATDWLQGIHPDDRAAYEAFKQQALQENCEVEYRLLSPTGKTYWLRDSAYPVPNAQGQIFRLTGIVEDTTQQKQIEERLKLQERAIAANNNGIIIVDARQPYHPTIFVNPAFEKMTGYSRHEVLGRNCRFLQGDEHDQPGLQILRKALKKGSGCKVTLRNYRKDGSTFWNELNISPIYDEQSRVTHYIGIQMDVTKRIQSEEILKRTNDLLQTISQAQSQFITAGNRLTIFEGLLTSLLDLSNSEYGFIGEVLFREDGSAVMEESFLKIQGVPYLKTHSTTNISWDEETRKFYEENYEQGMEFGNMNTLFGAVLMTGKVVIANQPQSDPRRGGIPDGHPPLNAFLGIPFYSGSVLVGMVGIANRPGGYDESLVTFLQPFLVTCSNLIEGYRVDRQRQRAEDQLKMSLRDKEILLKEIHHRVKNNLLVVSSLLNWQEESIQDPQILRVFEDSQKRISTIALVHEKLYRSPDLARIDFGEYLETLTQQLFASLSPDDDRIQLCCEFAPIQLNIETVSPCGLIVNELVINALEHAFPNQRCGTLSLRLSQDSDGLICLTVQDDGVGFPTGLDFRQTESLGWQLICLLVEQLEGKIQVMREAGTRIEITFMELNYQTRV